MFAASKKRLFDMPYARKTARRSTTHTIGVVVHELQSDFIKTALLGMEHMAARLGYKLVITHSQESMEKEVANVQILLEQEVDGLIASLSFGTTNLDHFKQFAKRGAPVVFFDRVEKHRGNTVVIDNVGTGYAATRHLIQQGCKRIAIVTSCLERNVYAHRYKGYRNALYDHQIAFADPLLILNDISEEAGVEAARRIMAMKERPDGVFVTNDLVAATCMHTLIENDIRVPDDIAIVGFNNDSICKLTVPTITTINYPGIHMGQTAFAALINNITGKENGAQPETAVIPANLVVRHSSLKNACY
jgi:LacI family transcriptional regulator